MGFGKYLSVLKGKNTHVLGVSILTIQRLDTPIIWGMRPFVENTYGVTVPEELNMYSFYVFIPPGRVIWFFRVNINLLLYFYNKLKISVILYLLSKSYNTSVGNPLKNFLFVLIYRI